MLANRQLADGPAPQVATGTRGAAAGTSVGKLNIWGNLSETNTEQEYAALPGYSTGFARSDIDILNTCLLYTSRCVEETGARQAGEEIGT